MPDIVERFADRRARCWLQLIERGVEVDAFLVTGAANVRYLSGFTGSNGVLLLGPDGCTLGTDGRYVIQAGQECPGLPLHVDRATVSSLLSRWWTGAQGRLAVEADHLTLAQYREIVAACPGGEDSIAAVSGVVERLRMVKDEHEMVLLRRACSISDDALAATATWVRAGVSEREVARHLEGQMLELGADGISFETIVGAGPHSAIPHHRPTSRPLKPGDLVVIDFGAEVGGYHADETRTFVVGEPADWQVDLHALVRAAQGAGREAACAGTNLVDIDGAARSVIDAAGEGDHFDHGLGHGVGLEIHEAPMIGPRATGMLVAGVPITVEPGVYLPDRGGVRIEDTVVVSAGPCEPLTASDRGLLVLG